MDNKIWANFLPLKSHETTLAALISLGKGAISTLHKTKTTPYLSKIAPWCHRLFVAALGALKSLLLRESMQFSVLNNLMRTV